MDEAQLTLAQLRSNLQLDSNLSGNLSKYTSLYNKAYINLEPYRIYIHEIPQQKRSQTTINIDYIPLHV